MLILGVIRELEQVIRFVELEVRRISNLSYYVLLIFHIQTFQALTSLFEAKGDLKLLTKHDFRTTVRQREHCFDTHQVRAASIFMIG